MALTSKISDWLWSIVNGEPLYSVKFEFIECDRRNFQAPLFCSNESVLGDIEQYGLALYTARMFKNKQWVFTSRNTLVCESGKLGLGIICAKIIVEDNLELLAERHARVVREGDTFEVRIPSFGRDGCREPGVGPFPVTFVREIN